MVHLGQLRRDNGGLFGRCLIRPWEGGELIGTELGEQSGYIGQGFGMTPKLESVLFLESQVNA